MLEISVWRTNSRDMVITERKRLALLNKTLYFSCHGGFELTVVVFRIRMPSVSSRAARPDRMLHLRISRCVLCYVTFHNNFAVTCLLSCCGNVGSSQQYAWFLTSQMQFIMYFHVFHVHNIIRYSYGIIL